MVTQVGDVTSANNGNGNDVTLSLPSGLAEGDVVFVFGGNSGTGGAGIVTAGWTVVSSSVGSSSSAVVGYKVMGATPDTSVVLDNTGGAQIAMVGIAVALRGVDTADPIGATSAWVSGVDPASVASVPAGAWVFGWSAADGEDSFVDTSTVDGWTRVNLRRSETQNVQVGLQYRESAGGTEDPPDWSPVWDVWNAAESITLAVNAEATGQNVTAGRGTEADTALAAAGSKAITAGQAPETDTALPGSPGKAVTAAQGPEADTARPLAPAKSSQALQGPESDTALPAAAGKTVTLALATETDVALAAGTSASGSTTLGLAPEADTALPAAGAKTVVLALATEVDTAAAVDTAKAATLAPATEADTATAGAAAKATVLGRGTEADTSYAVSGSAALVLALAAEADAGLALVVRVGDLLDHFPRATASLDPSAGAAALDPAAGRAVLDPPAGVAALDPATASVSLD